ncbi:MAG: enolase C-terminal domain-like protein [Nocardioidaceae bacterium]
MTSAVDRVEIFVVPVPFRRPFVLGSGVVGGTAAAGDVVFVKLTATDGSVGWGEQRALPSWSYETADTIRSVIEHQLSRLVIGSLPVAVERYHRSATRMLSPSVSNGFPFARAAVEMALHDLVGRQLGVPISALLGGAVHSRIPLTSAIGVGAPSEVADRMAESADYHAYKIKISGDVEHDVAALRAAAAGAKGKPLWLDANQSYRPAALYKLLERIRDVPGVCCLEQPVPSTDWGALARLRSGGIRLPIAVDEGSFSAADLARTATLGGVDLAVVKICKAGGLRPATRTAAVAAAHGIEILASGLTDTGVGFAAAMHLFSLYDLALPAELNGPELLAELYVDGLDIVDGSATVPTGAGLGIEVDGDRIRGTATGHVVVV